MHTPAPLAIHEFHAGELSAAVEFLKRARSELRSLHRVLVWADKFQVFDINRDYFASEPGQAMIKRIPQRRLGSPDDLTGPLLLLASAAGAHMTGAVLTVDGGHSVNPL